MTPLQTRYAKEEIARRGDAIYDRDIRPQVEADNQGKIVLIDVDTGAWEMDDDEMTAARRLDARYPKAQVWMTRVGSRYVYQIGASHKRRVLSMKPTRNL